MNHQHAKLNTLTGSWPFMQWGIDLVRHLKEATGNRQYLIMAIVATNQFSKWIEAEPLMKITVVAVNSFVQKKIICRFGMPHTIMADNELQFTSSEVTDWYKELKIRHLTSTPRYLQGNRQVNASNKTILQCLNKRLEKKSKWSEQLPKVLQAYHPIIQKATGETPFSTVNGTKAVILVQFIIMPNLHTKEMTALENAGILKIDLDFTEEWR